MSDPRIRAASDDDLPRLTEIYNHYIVNTTTTFDIEPFTVERRRREWFSHYAAAGPHRVIVAEQDGALLGFAYSSPFRPKRAYDTSVETSVYCDAEMTGRGIGGLLYAALFEALEGEDVHRAFALITLPNDPSEKLHRRFGFTIAGALKEVGRKFDHYYDVAIYQKTFD